VSSERAQSGRTDPETGVPEPLGRDEGEPMAEAAETGTEQPPPAARTARKRTQPKTAAASAAPSTRTPTPRKRATPAKPRTAASAGAGTTTSEPEPPAAPAAVIDTRPSVLTLHGLSKHYGSTVAVDDVSLDVREGSFYGIVGPNGAGKTTTLSMVTGLLRPDEGRIVVHGVDVWTEPVRAKHVIGVLPDKLRLFDRLTGAQFLHYAGTLRGLSAKTVRARASDLAVAFGIEDALDRLVADYSAGMTKKIALAAAMIHSPRLLVLDEPFESVDPVSAANVIDILERYTAAGGTVVLSSHGMDMIQRVCDSVAIIVSGKVLAAGTIDEVRGERTLEERFVELAGGRKAAEGMEWLHSFSD
jgi:ABC-2 type transport system ATP-binding protein